MLNVILNFFLIVGQNLPDCRMQMLAALAVVGGAVFPLANGMSKVVTIQTDN